MNVLCIRVPTISREWARKFKKVIFVNHDVTAYFTNISSSSSTSDTLPRKLDSTSQENRIFKGKITFLRKGGAHCFYSWYIIVLQNNHQADWVEGGLLLGWWLFQVNYSDAHYTLYREGATLYTIHCILHSIQGRCHTIIIHYTGRVPRGSACSQGGRRVASSGGFLLRKMTNFTALSSSTPPSWSYWWQCMESITAQMVCSITLLLLLSPLALAGECFRALRKVVPHNPPNIKSSISPREAFVPNPWQRLTTDGAPSSPQHQSHSLSRYWELFNVQQFSKACSEDERD